MEHTPGINLIAATGGTLLSLYALHTGWLRYRQGTMPDEWNEHLRILMYANLLNFMLRRPQQKRLTVRQIRVAGIVYMGIGVFGLMVIAAGMGLIPASLR